MYNLLYVTVSYSDYQILVELEGDETFSDSFYIEAHRVPLRFIEKYQIDSKADVICFCF